MAIQIDFDASGESTRIIRSALVLIIVFVGGFILWACFAPIRGAVVAPGTIKVSTHRKTVQHLEGGVVREIRVKEGQHVAQGEVLLVLEDSEVRANLAILMDQLHYERVRTARLLAEKSLAKAIDIPSDLPAEDPKVRALIESEKVLFQNKMKALEEQVAVIRAEMGHAGDQEKADDAQAKSVQAAIRSKRERLAAGEVLSEKQYLEKNQVLQMREELAQTEATLAQLQSNKSALKQQEAELELRIINLRNEFIKAADLELKDARNATYEVEERIRPARVALAHFSVMAPIAGQVMDLKVTTQGGVIRSGDPLMDIVPSEHEVVLEVRVRPLDIPKVHVGQAADVQLLSYSTRAIPHLDGAVTYISKDALDPAPPQTNEAYYLAHVLIHPSELSRFPHVVLSPGMPVTAFIQTAPRTFMDMLLKPFSESVSQGLRSEAP